MRHEFDWDPVKAKANQAKHGVRFEDAMAVFQDPLALSILDSEHGANEERWVTLGEGGDAKLLVVVHSYRDTGEGRAEIRIISARRPTKRETKQYRESSGP